MAISSLPSRYGIGCFSQEAYEFVDALKAAGQTCWQILPLGPTSYGDSPYQSFSTFAGNPYFICPETLIKKGWLTQKQCDAYDFGKKADKVDYEALYNGRFDLLRKAFAKSGLDGTTTNAGKSGNQNKSDLQKAFQAYIQENQEWLPDYALYMAIKSANGNRSWIEWDEDLRTRKAAALKKAREQYAKEILFYEFLQFEFAQEWKELKAYANEQGIQIIGDIPIYVAYDSADAWASPELFQFEEDGTPTAVAGCPPDAFTADGQLWGNPLYRWDYHQQTGFAWWMRRLKHVFALYDVVRIDHFRGFDEYYSIPYPAENARKGKWVKGPGFELFKVMKQELGEQAVIAEDLGYLTNSVRRLVKRTGYPGMKVLQFAFDSREESDYLPHNYTAGSVVYTGTHDNETTVAWYDAISAKDRKFVQQYLHLPADVTGKDVAKAMIRTAYASVSDLCVIPMQDVLGLPGSARMNFPSTLGGNWQWRMKPGAFTKARQKELLDLSRTYGRAPRK